MKPLVDGGYLRFAYGGAETGKYLTNHPNIDEIHITGSDKTFDAIVFGEGAEGAQRKLRDEAMLEQAHFERAWKRQPDDRGSRAVE